MVNSLTEFATMLRSEKAHPFVQTEGALREVHDAITDLMKQLANEPSVGLYFVQQHVQKAVPNMILLKARMADNTQDLEYVTQDVRDALNSVRSIKEVGPAVIERMIKTLDSSLPRLASLRPSKRNGRLQDSLTRSGECTDSLLLGLSEKQSNSPRSPTFSSVAISSGDPADSSSTSASTQSHFNPTLLDRESSAQVPLEKENYGHSISSGNYSGYMRTMFDSAVLKANSVAIVAKWNTYSKSTKLETSASGIGGDTLVNVKSGLFTESNPSLNDQNVLGAADGRDDSLTKTALDSSTGTSASKDKLSDESSDPSLGRTPFLPGLRDFTDFGKPGQLVQSLFGSPRHTTGNVSVEGSNFRPANGKKPSSTADKPLEGWSWLQAPGKALRSFNKQRQSSEGWTVNGASGEGSSDSASKEEIERLLDMERASCETFAAEKAAKLEEWLGGTEEDNKENN